MTRLADGWPNSSTWWASLRRERVLTIIRTSSLGDAPTGDDRDGDLLRTQTAHRRRTHDYLDVTVQAQILDLILRLQRELGMAVILITHDLGVVAGLCDRVNVMYAGYIVESADVDTLFRTPRHPYTLGLLRSVSRIDEPRKERLVPIEGLPPTLVDLPVGCPFAPRCVYRVEWCDQENPGRRVVAPDHEIACWVDAGGRVPR